LIRFESGGVCIDYKNKFWINTYEVNDYSQLFMIVNLVETIFIAYITKHGL